ncbi:hypothetical protein HYV80_05455 [Candidatus Woesearchaeota archaeon]|nr:hypothetical protein [Candidatus Woesearchaeota archaeon]
MSETKQEKNPTTMEEIVRIYNLPHWPRGDCRLTLTLGWTIDESGNVVNKTKGRRLAEFSIDGIFTGEHTDKFFYFEASDGRKLEIPLDLGSVYIPKPPVEPEVKEPKFDIIAPRQEYL